MNSKIDACHEYVKMFFTVCVFPQIAATIVSRESGRFREMRAESGEGSFLIWGGGGEIVT